MFGQNPFFCTGCEIYIAYPSSPFLIKEKFTIGVALPLASLFYRQNLHGSVWCHPKVNSQSQNNCHWWDDGNVFLDGWCSWSEEAPVLVASLGKRWHGLAGWNCFPALYVISTSPLCPPPLHPLPCTPSMCARAYLYTSFHRGLIRAPCIPSGRNGHCTLVAFSAYQNNKTFV